MNTLKQEAWPHFSSQELKHSFYNIYCVLHRKRSHHNVIDKQFYFMNEESALEFLADKKLKPNDENEWWSDVKKMKAVKFDDNTVYLLDTELKFFESPK